MPLVKIGQVKVNLSPELQELIDQHPDKDWNLQSGTKHVHLYLEGRLVMVLSRHRKGKDSQARNACGIVRRALRALENEKSV